ncbi:hypothetical protein, partial [Pseudomonas cannabina]
FRPSLRLFWTRKAHALTKEIRFFLRYEERQGSVGIRVENGLIRWQLFLPLRKAQIAAASGRNVF